ncbi:MULTISPECIES: 6-phosphofructokinase [unclassified Aureispira]|uniref:6-phosphofructokinase n=1 Tax=unclassified Aureispira TaxID=2649989 RepID=UPI000695AFDE|nr:MULTISPECIES: 6-phosphofructokinase [unclassified Aureispira]WMX14105.1 6-phosphofructokinase [Aureispira sp. CCB-E]
MKKIAVFTSGGDAPGMNACIRAVVRAAIHYNIEVVGIRRGYKGMINDDFIPMNSKSVSYILHKGGTILGSARSDEFRTAMGRKKAYNNLKKHGIDGIVAIGGDGTFTGANIFMQEYPDIAIVGTPGTIDNDLYGTDFTIGYDTAINTAMEAIDKIKDTADSHDRLFFVEVMGRDVGFIAARAGIAAGAKAILIPESKTNIDELVQQLLDNAAKKKLSNIVVVAEGDDEGGALEISKKVKAQTDIFDIRVTILGHMQRGGSPTCMDRVLASRVGVAAVEALKKGQKGVMLGQLHREIHATPFEKAIKHHKKMSTVLEDLSKILAF